MKFVAAALATLLPLSACAEAESPNAEPAKTGDRPRLPRRRHLGSVNWKVPGRSGEGFITAPINHTLPERPPPPRGPKPSPESFWN